GGYGIQAAFWDWTARRSSRRTVRTFMAEWLAAVGDSVKPSTRQNYADYIRAYVDPIIGDRRLQDVTVPVLNLLYRRLLHREPGEDGSQLGDVHLTGPSTGPSVTASGRRPADLVAACGVSIHAARAAVLRV